MNATNQTDRRSTALLGILLALGLIIGGWVLGAQIKATRLSDRYVTVKGLVERTVKSDLAIWSLSYKEAGDDLALLYAKTEADKKTILQFLDSRESRRQKSSSVFCASWIPRPTNTAAVTARPTATSSNR
jgi:hypothetical protein